MKPPRSPSRKGSEHSSSFHVLSKSHSQAGVMDMDVTLSTDSCDKNFNDPSRIQPSFPTSLLEAFDSSLMIGSTTNKKSASPYSKKKHTKKVSSSGGRLGGRRQRRRRLWQLPESSIDDYRKWIQEKPEADRTPNEQRFLWKCMIRSLGVVPFESEVYQKKRPRQERIREFVERLESRAERSATEEQFVRMYHQRKIQRKAAKARQQQQETCENADEPIVWWTREDTNNNHRTKNHQYHRHHQKTRQNSRSGLEPLAGLESLRESMNMMGLSSDNLKQVRFGDLPQPQHDRTFEEKHRRASSHRETPISQPNRTVR